MNNETEHYIDHLFEDNGKRIVCRYCMLDLIEWKTMGKDIRLEAETKCANIYYELLRMKKEKASNRLPPVTGQIDLFK